MKLGKVIGTLTPCTVYKGLEGVPMLFVQPLDKHQKPFGFYIPGEMVRHQNNQQNKK